jgi:uncharacterized protein YerC
LGRASDLQDRAKYWDEAFDAFVLELVEAAKSKPASLVRALGLVYGFLTDLPTEEEVQTYAQRVQNAWHRHQLDQDFPIVIRMCEQAVRYHPYIQTGYNEKDT